MESAKLSGWLSVGANFGVVIGLILVLLQMNQNEKLLRVQLENQYYDSYISTEANFAGENMPAIWEKSILRPQDLSIADARALESLTWSPLFRFISLYRLAEAGILDDSVWQAQVDADASYFFGTPYGMAWWESSRASMDPQFLPLVVKEAVDRALVGVDVHRSQRAHEAIIARAVELSSATE